MAKKKQETESVSASLDGGTRIHGSQTVIDKLTRRSGGGSTTRRRATADTPKVPSTDSK